MSESESHVVESKPERRWLQYSLRPIRLATLLCATLLSAGFDGQEQRRIEIARNWVQACSNQKYPDNNVVQRYRRWPPVPPCPVPLNDDEKRIVLKMAVTRLESPRQRIAGLRILLESGPATALETLREALRDERDPEVKASELRLTSLYRDKTTADMVSRCLDNADSRVRAAAADALGLIHCPAYPIPAIGGFDRDEEVFKSDPPIKISPLTEWVTYQGNPSREHNFDDCLPTNVIDLPASKRAALEVMMLNGPTSEERIAAARALLAWPPAGYRLRVAEWGVWISDGGQLKLVQSVLDEIPPFVHRTGNTVASLSDRLNPIIVIDKPVVHVTADRPLAADFEVLITQGRPWFAYPQPDDFTMTADVRYGDLGEQPRLETSVRAFDSAHVPELRTTAEGYPWLMPPHRGYGSFSGSAGASDNEITDLGLRWQNLVISPSQQSWMKPPPIVDRPRYGWWDRLRAVPSCWLSSHGESERFLYYDGPTHIPSPVHVVVNGRTLHLKSIALQPSRATGAAGENERYLVSQASGDYGTKRHGLYIEVAGGKATARVVPVADGESEVDLEAIIPLTAAAAQKHFLATLIEYGLTADEAAGLADVWKRQFWETPGKRLLVILSAKDYDAMCPLRVRPKPTELVRLGVLLTELEK